MLRNRLNEDLKGALKAKDVRKLCKELALREPPGVRGAGPVVRSPVAEGATRPFADPYFWAGFILIGDWE